ncbi:hypothetical protein A0H81_13315 [Grifola frondosa]|uniref:SHSP domain-containing protein n=1 Tax=Grifola frondosa TaxID=5627 RepID=A0A1C7LVH9_GRIFR|nr:hypothetical protein A0H81_13315 [Grifola frondosa]
MTLSAVATSKTISPLKALDRNPTFADLDRFFARMYVASVKRKAARRLRTEILKPRMELYDDPSNPRIMAVLELPGMNAEELSVRIDDSHLVIEGERHGPLLHKLGIASPQPNTTVAPDISETLVAQMYPVRELKYGKFHRSIVVPPGICASQVHSSLVDGMLTLSWPRNPSTETNRNPPSIDALYARWVFRSNHTFLKLLEDSLTHRCIHWSDGQTQLTKTKSSSLPGINKNINRNHILRNDPQRYIDTIMG